jgi:HEAT repeat protein
MAALGRKAAGVVGALVEALGDGDETVRENVKESLSYLGPAAAPAVPALVRSLQDQPDSYYAYAALQKVGAAARPAVPALVSIFRDKHAERESREWAGTALLSIDPAGDESQAAFKEALGDPVSSLQAIAARGLRNVK